LGISPLGGELFSPAALGVLAGCDLTNDVLSQCFRKLGWFWDEESRSMIRVSYGSLNVEEFGSVYEGLLEYDPKLTKKGNGFAFDLVKGEERSTSGSYYTPEELTQPLIHHSLDHVIDAKKEEEDLIAGLLSISVCDAACGSGHFLLGAARRIGLELARATTGHEQPAPGEIRRGVRDAIKNCIYGVDVNPYAVELCKVALWLEAHEPGEPLNFLDHRIKCGDAVVGLGRQEDLGRGIADKAFKTRPGDEKSVASRYRKKNSKERNESGDKQNVWSFAGNVDNDLKLLQGLIKAVVMMPESDPGDIEEKKQAYMKMLSGPNFSHLKSLADLQTAQFFLPKIEANEHVLCTEGDYRSYLVGEVAMTGSGQITAAKESARGKKFFHWFLEFPAVFAEGGFDCMIGNPPFLGGKKITTVFGQDFLDYMKQEYSPAGAIDLVGYFFRRYFELLRSSGHFGLLATNTIAQGGTREGSLHIISEQGGEISFAVRSMPWPGVASVSVSLVAISKGPFAEQKRLDGLRVDRISTYLDDSEALGDPLKLVRNADMSFVGSYLLGKGFVLDPKEAELLIRKNPENRDVIFPYLNGEDLNSRFDQSPSRYVINFFDWPIEQAKKYSDCFRIVEERVKPQRTRKKDDGTFALRKPLPQKWWIYADKRPKLYHTIERLERVLVIPETTKFETFTFENISMIFSHMIKVIATDRFWVYAFLQSSLHTEWARRYCSTLDTRLKYNTTDAFETFPFPSRQSATIDGDKLGIEYHELRSEICKSTGLGLTNIYNQYHNIKLSYIDSGLRDNEIEGHIGKESFKLRKYLTKNNPNITFNDFVDEIVKLRVLHEKVDVAAADAYGWNDIDVSHDFYNVEYLPENDRVRYTINPEARKEVLKRLLKLNHQYHEEEVAQGIADEKGKAIKSAKQKKVPGDDLLYGELFSPEERGELI
ncbi:MAG: N-6 DNA methylase, partial [Spirochaetales bacterium]|nr:N-6 DNA methylase [Spirochaetales bacterium]